MLYFLLHDAERFQRQLAPLLSAAWRERSFAPCRKLHDLLLPDIRVFHDSIGRSGDETLIEKAADGLAFDRLLWRELVGEALWFGAAEAPNFQTEPELLCCLLSPERYRAGDGPREVWSPIEQAHFGSRDLLLGGGYYRPSQTGWNDGMDVARLHSELTRVDASVWKARSLADCSELKSHADRDDALEDARAALPRLLGMYRRAEALKQVVICEEL